MTSWRRLFLAVPGLALLALDFTGLRFQESDELTAVIVTVLAQGAIYFVAAFWVVSRRPSPLWLILVFAALLRLPLLLSEPYQSDDVYRYVWDGRVQAAGINPYRHVPDAPQLEELRDEDIYPNINRSDYAVTIYPPAAQLFFLLTTRVSESVTWMKASLLAWEAVAIALLVLLLRRARRPDGLVLLYAWHPLPLWEFAGNGHLDAAAIACILAALLARARGRRALAGVALGIATLFKLYPLGLLPALWRPGDRRMPAALAATVSLGYLPYLGVGWGVLGFLPEYVREEGVQGGPRYYLLHVLERLGVHLGPADYLVPVGLALAALSAWICFRRRPRDDFAGGALLLASAAVVAFSPHYPWYFAWLLPLAALATSTPILLLGVQAILLYLESWPRLGREALIYGPFLLFALFALSRARTPGRSSPVVRRSREGADGERPQPAA
jgi:alpha-1,6-mannosyltransferase